MKKPKVKRPLDFKLVGDCADTIRINDKEYSIHRHPPHAGLVASINLTFMDDTKTVTLHTAGEWDCTCQDFIYRGSQEGRDCKHIIACRELGIMFEDETGRPDPPDWLVDEKSSEGKTIPF